MTVKMHLRRQITVIVRAKPTLCALAEVKPAQHKCKNRSKCTSWRPYQLRKKSNAGCSGGKDTVNCTGNDTAGITGTFTAGIETGQ